MPLTVELSDYIATGKSGPPSYLGTRYDRTRFLPEAGNTVVCHLDTSEPAHQAVLAARAGMQALAGNGFLFTPVQSLHMTLFEGVIETRRTADAWPHGIARDAPVADVTEILLKRLVSAPAHPGFSVRATGIRPAGLLLEGATPEDETAMRAWRDALTEPFGYRHTTHGSYRFHMTFAYPVDWIPEAEAERWHAGLHTILADLVEAAPTIPLKPPAFCRFADMTWFEELKVLGA
ncbi:MAG: DUF1868 domain-containing protein [Pseudomonadota bacterium]